MLAQYLDLLGATNSRKSKRQSDKAVNSPQASKERVFHIHILVKSLCITAQNYISGQCFSLRLVPNLFLFFTKFQAPVLFKLFV